MEIFTTLIEVIKSALTITSLVMVMMLLIEFVNVSSSGKLMKKLQHRPLFQIVLSAFLGLIPGCLGGFTIVSLYTHRLLSFGALVAGMITTFGDEAFVIFAYSPKITLILSALLVGIGIVTGVITGLVFKKKRLHKKEKTHSLEIHHDEHCHDHHAKAELSFRNLKKISFPRASLLFGLTIYLIAILTGTFSHEHGGMPVIDDHQHETHEVCEGHDHHHEHDHAESEMHVAHDHSVFSWENIIFMTLALITIVIVALSSEHFLHSHLWEHVIKKHFLSVFLWTFGVLIFLHLLYLFIDVGQIIENNQWALLLILLMAILIGVIPESGPHLIFVVMYFSGSIPFSILLANSIVQDGHGALPLLADSRKDFFLMKSITMIVGLIVGLIGYFAGF